MSHKIRDIGVSDQNWKYRDPVEVRPNLRWLFTSGTPGLELRGTLPADITGQTKLAWKHLLSMLKQANMDLTDVVKVTQYLPRAGDVEAYAKVKTHFLDDVEPASMLLVVPQLVWLEVEVIAAARAH